LAAGPAFALARTKEMLNAWLGLDLDHALDNEARAQAICMQTRDFREAHDAFLEKRSPRFSGG
jgi:enoyl-CoA hydratase/carnithine racemase